jgi:hypothetical protein
MWLILAIAVGIGYLGIGWAGHLLGEVSHDQATGYFFVSLADSASLLRLSVKTVDLTTFKV